MLRLDTINVTQRLYLVDFICNSITFIVGVSIYKRRYWKNSNSYFKFNESQQKTGFNLWQLKATLKATLTHTIT